MSETIATAYVQLLAQGGAPFAASIHSAGQQGGNAYATGMAGGVERQRGRLSSAIGGALRVGAAGAVGGAIAVGAGLKGAISSAMDFDLIIRQIGVSTGQTGADLDKMREYALKMGAETSFSAREAGDAMLELAKSGLTAAEIQGGGLATTLDLAAAGSLGLADAAGFVTSSMGQFGLSAEEAARASAALAGAANASKSDVSDVGQALAQVGTVANTAGFSVEETTAAIAAMSKAGIEGSDAGTSLKSMISNLIPATTKARGTMNDYGIVLTKRNGDFKDMAEVAEELKTGLDGLSESDTQRALKNMFGSDGVRAGTILMRQGAEGMEKLNAATSDNTALQEMAKTATDGATGALDAFKGSIETLGIRVGDKLLPVFTDVVNGGTEIVNALGGIFSGKGIPGLGGTGGNSVLTNGMETISEVTGDVLDAGREVWDGLKAGWGELQESVGGILEEHGPMIENIQDVMGDIAGEAMDVLGPALKWLAEEGLDAAGEAFEFLFDSIKAGGNVFFGFSQITLGMAGTVVEAVTDMGANVIDIFIGMAQAVEQIPGAPDMSGSITNLSNLRSNMEGFGDDFRAVSENMKADLAEQQWEWNLTASEAAELGNRIRMLPDKIEMAVRVPGAFESYEKVKQLQKVYDLTPEEVLTVVQASGTQLTTKQIRKLADQVEMTPRQIALLVKQSGGVKTVADVRKVLDIAKATDKQEIRPILKVLGVDVSVADFKKIKREGIEVDKLEPTPRVHLNTGGFFPDLANVSQALRNLDGDSATTYIYTQRRDSGRALGGNIPETNGRVSAGRSLTVEPPTPAGSLTGYTPRRGGRLALVEGRLTIDEDGSAWIRGVARDEIDDASDFAGTLTRMGG